MSIDSRTEPRGARIRRRLVTIPRLFLFLILTTVTLPLLVVVALLVDVVRWITARKPFVAVRMILFMWAFLAISTGGVMWMFLNWIAAGFGRRKDSMVHNAYRVQRWWARSLFASVGGLFGFDMSIEGHELVRPGPIIAMFRHASIVDNLLPALLITDRENMKLRWVIKRELLADPALDVGGNRLPNYFVSRTSRDPDEEAARIAGLAEGLDDDGGVLIFPEGTRFTEEKKRRILKRLEKRDPELFARAKEFRNLLPPRFGGPLALLDTGIDVVFCAHHGLGGFAHLKDIWGGGMVGQKISVKFWRVAATDIPSGEPDRKRWLLDQWQTMDEWITSVQDAAKET
ncbi:MAG: 1-acyl-sn-glycerol-3-phosphate acyltransferase [Acidimicrobiia bacterium]|nr:1-acyl-sn-glycerol-3-phosphate acyltransferase [Acidimicrobiia bacterium]